MATKTCISIIGQDGDNPIRAGDSQGNLLRLAELLKKLASGHKPVSYTVHANYSAEQASGTVTAAAVQAADTFTVAGVTFTAQQAYATGTVTCASVAANDTVTIDGVVFTAKASPSGIAEFDQSGDDTADAASLVTKVNAHPNLTTRVTATSAAGVVTFRAYSAGTGGNSITLASSNGTRLGVSGATLENGAAVANAKFCFTGSNTECATDMVRAVLACTTAPIPQILTASNAAGVVTLTCKIPGRVGNQITLASSNGTRLAVSAAKLASGTETALSISL